MPRKHDVELLPKTEPERVALVGNELYGRSFRSRLAKGLGFGRTKMWEIMSGRGKADADLDARLIDLMDAEADAAAARGLRITALRRRFQWSRTDA